MPVLLLRTPSFKAEIISTCLRALFCQFFHGKCSDYLQRQKLLPAEKSSAVLARKEHCSGKHNLVAFHRSQARVSSSLTVLRPGTVGPRMEPRAPQQRCSAWRHVLTAGGFSVLAPQPWQVGAMPAMN